MELINQSHCLVFHIPEQWQDKYKDEKKENLNSYSLPSLYCSLRIAFFMKNLHLNCDFIPIAIIFHHSHCTVESKYLHDIQNLAVNICRVQLKYYMHEKQSRRKCQDGRCGPMKTGRWCFAPVSNHAVALGLRMQCCCLRSEDQNHGITAWFTASLPKLIFLELFSK